MNILRTYPQPDSPRPNIGPRERAMAVLKYLVDMEPGDAIKHHVFPLLVHAFEQSERRGWNDCVKAVRAEEQGDVVIADDLPALKELQPSLCEELSKSIEGTAPRVRLFGEDSESRGNDGL